MSAINEIGNRYGSLTVIERAERANAEVAWWVCRCDCGKTTEARGTNLRYGSTRSCGCGIGRGKDETGNRYGMLVVLKRAEDSDRRGWRWLCQCDCGNTTVVNGSELRKGSTTGCGCRQIKYEEGEAALNLLIGHYKKNAEKRGIEWQLTKKQVRKLTKSNCHYCGCSPSNVSSGTRLNGDYVYSGIDRKNPNKGYETGNVVPCCKRCNFAKYDSTYDEFLQYLDSLVMFRTGKS